MNLSEQLNIIARAFSFERVTTAQARSAAPIINQASAELVMLRTTLFELGKWADKAAMVLATIDAEDATEDEELKKIINGISVWAPDALLGER